MHPELLPVGPGRVGGSWRVSSCENRLFSSLLRCPRTWPWSVQGVLGFSVEAQQTRSRLEVGDEISNYFLADEIKSSSLVQGGRGDYRRPHV